MITYSAVQSWATLAIIGGLAAAFGVIGRELVRRGGRR